MPEFADPIGPNLSGEKMPSRELETANTVLHEKARSDHPAYIAEGMTRLQVPDEMVSWDKDFPGYDAAEQAAYYHSAVLNQWNEHGESGWAAAPGTLLRADEAASYCQPLPVDERGNVLNPAGRTGIKEGRGLLGQPGANFAADPVIFRVNQETSKIELLVIERKDTGHSALPGGMVDFGELISGTLQRELEEETGLKLSMNDAELVYQGYVDDPRNTDRAWMETTAAVKLLPADEAMQVELEAGDDARKAEWRELTPELLDSLYASHSKFVKLAIEKLKINSAEELVDVAEQLARV